MAVPAPPAQPETTSSHGAAGIPPPPVLEVLGRRVAPMPASTAWPAPPVFDDDAAAALRRLAFEALLETARLRQELADRDDAIAELREDVRVWKDRARTLSAARTEEKRVSQRRERELVTVLHRSLTDNDAMRAELDWRRTPWWRRGRRPMPGPSTPAQLLGSAPR